jgi:hypothetical protein
LGATVYAGTLQAMDGDAIVFQEGHRAQLDRGQGNRVRRALFPNGYKPRHAAVLVTGTGFVEDWRFANDPDAYGVRSLAVAIMDMAEQARALQANSPVSFAEIERLAARFGAYLIADPGQDPAVSARLYRHVAAASDALDAAWLQNVHPGTAWVGPRPDWGGIDAL